MEWKPLKQGMEWRIYQNSLLIIIIYMLCVYVYIYVCVYVYVYIMLFFLSSELLENIKKVIETIAIIRTTKENHTHIYIIYSQSKVSHTYTHSHI